MLFLDYTQVQYCKLRGKEKPISGIIYNGTIFVRAKAFPKEELELAIKECREEYLDHEVRSQIPTLLIKEKNSVGIWMKDKRYQQGDIIEVIGSEKSLTTASSNTNTNTKAAKSKSNSKTISLKQLASEMRSEKGVDIKTRRHKLKLYQRCFLGNEAVDWIVERVKISRSDAVKLGQKMLEKGMFHHALDEHQFKDETLFYRFKEDEGKSLWNSNV